MNYCNGLKRYSTAVLLLFVSLFFSAGQAAPSDFQFVDIHGETVDFEDYRGKWVVVNYWATWCPPCLEEIPELIHFHERHKNDTAVVVGFNMEEKSPELLSEFVEENMMTYPVVPMSDDLALVGDVPGLPTTYLLDPTGKPVAMQVGEITAEMLEKFIAGNNR
ncbi:MAG: TlpA family protein disulfide reductase [Gammaproteobacteria bacterium]|nr:TlpA family protein disulfide reductase [Gammaproteobacteria bacterium]MCW8927756.1 TlpA family protein disulfide reductase [Gammaproteobacteria bacterium]MCW8972233.1 TlpA family protein disulfide reductase [Gammaproteobacteria bacterium]MCW8993734.1 TlpA family protein disulfide reductase [Gammaproteobacteria bacterium]